MCDCFQLPSPRPVSALGLRLRMRTQIRSEWPRAARAFPVMIIFNTIHCIQRPTNIEYKLKSVYVYTLFLSMTKSF